jgi:hypothetical protein
MSLFAGFQRSLKFSRVFPYLGAPEKSADRIENKNRI